MNPNIRWRALAVAALTGLSGCAANDPHVPSDVDVCQGTYGLYYGTPAFADCMESRRVRRARLATALMANPNFPVPLPAGPPPVLPPPVYVVPPPVYVAPSPVYAAPPPVFVTPPTGYIPLPPVTVAPRPVIERSVTTSTCSSSGPVTACVDRSVAIPPIVPRLR